MMTGQRQPPAELTIGVVGPHDLVERIMLSGAVTPGQALSVTGAGPARRLVAAAYRGEQEAPDKVLRLGPAIDVFLFACPVSLESARRAGVLRVPATCVPLSGSALFAALLRARADGRHDLSRVSVDVLSRGDVEDAFGEPGIPVRVIRPTGSAIRAALRTATLLGAHRRLEEAQLAVVVVEVPTLRETT